MTAARRSTGRRTPRRLPRRIDQKIALEAGLVERTAFSQGRSSPRPACDEVGLQCSWPWRRPPGNTWSTTVRTLPNRPDPQRRRTGMVQKRVPARVAAGRQHMNAPERHSSKGRRAIAGCSFFMGIVCMVMIANLQYAGPSSSSDRSKSTAGARLPLGGVTIFVLAGTWLVPIEGYSGRPFGQAGRSGRRTAVRRSVGS